MQPDQESFEAARNAVSSSLPHDFWTWLMRGAAAALFGLTSTIAFLFKTSETRNAKDIASLIAQCDRLQAKVDQLTEEVSTLRSENATLRERNEWLNRTLESRIKSVETHQHNHEK